MPAITERDNIADLVIYENENYWYSRSTVTIATGQELTMGAVLKNNGGQFEPIDAAVGDEPDAILLADIDTTGGAATATVLDAEAIVYADKLVMNGDANQQAAVLAKLKAKGIKTR